ncbi:MAG: Flp pilus assembly protein CpaB [Firmicutes bacterium HGW-Firmicutes-4]|jgi:Flp pilus assembly protein CpaB|nr:MAG: Flp pilus assembly protein CpaB [Firmicutes bacterium HGW-Firmicutes-4]
MEKSMKKLIIIALIVSLITGMAVFQFATSLQRGADLQTQPIVLASQAIPKGTVIQKEMLKVAEIPVEMVHQLSIANQEDVIGRISKENIEANEQILTSRLSDTNPENNNLSYAIAPNFRGITIMVDEEKGVGGYLTKGDRVDLVTIWIKQDKTIVSEYVVENIEILQIGPSSAGDKGGEYTSVTVAVPANEVEKITYALSIDQTPKYRLVLRSPVDNVILGPTPFMPK